jgi:hypothetical protein
VGGETVWVHDVLYCRVVDSWRYGTWQTAQVRVYSSTAATVKPDGLRDRVCIARSIDAGGRRGSVYRVEETVPEAGEQQPNVSLANADKSVVGRTMLSQRRQKISVESGERPKAKPASLWQGKSRLRLRLRLLVGLPQAGRSLAPIDSGSPSGSEEMCKSAH